MILYQRVLIVVYAENLRRINTYQINRLITIIPIKTSNVFDFDEGESDWAEYVSGKDCFPKWYEYD